MYVSAATVPTTLLPRSIARYGRAPIESDSVELGSWLSSAFQSITGTHLSDVITPIASIAGSIVGGPAGGAIGNLVGGMLSGGGSGGNPAPSQQSSPQGNAPAAAPVPTTQNAAIGVSTDYLNGIANIVAASQLQQLAAPVQRQSQAPASGIDSKTLLIGGGVLLAAVLIAKA
jgi:hypothetical protein